MARERLQKLLAQSGVASRRAAEALIEAGRVRVNGRIVRELGTRADLHADRVEVDGRRLVAEKPVYYLLNKPREMVTTLSDPEGRATLADLLKRVPERVFPVGRLDYHTSGAMLVTNDGEMADALLHPTKGVPKTYIAKMRGAVEEKALQALRNGVVLDDGYQTAKAEVFVAREERGNSWLSITIREGKNRQIHRMGDAVGHRVMRLSRVEFAGLSVEGLRPGAMRLLGIREVDKLKKDYLNPKKRQKANVARARMAEANAEYFDGWGDEVMVEDQDLAPQAEREAPAKKRAASKGVGAAKGKPDRGQRAETTAQRAVRALSQKRAPADRSIGGARSRTEAPTDKKKTASKRGGAKTASKAAPQARKTAGKKSGTSPSKVARKAATPKSASSPSKLARKAKGTRGEKSPAQGRTSKASASPRRAATKRRGRGTR